MCTTAFWRKGQAIIPKALRVARRWGPGTQLEVRDTPEGVLLSPPAPVKKVALTSGLAAFRRRVAYRGLVVSLPQMDAALLREAALLAIVSNDYDPLATGHVADLARPGGRITGVSMRQTELPATGHVASLARPGGRVTGIHQLQEELSAKRLELLKELLPKARRIAVLADAATKRQLVVVQAAAKRLGLELVVHEFERAPYDFEEAFARFARAKAEALLPLGSGLFVPAHRKIPELALKDRLPGMYNNALWADAGGSLAYGVNFPAAFRRAAEMMALILNGKKPAEMPVKQSTTFDLVINMPTARALGVSIPQGILLRANRLIE